MAGLALAAAPWTALAQHPDVAPESAPSGARHRAAEAPAPPLEQARQARRAGRLHEAQDLLRRALRGAPGDDALRLELARLLEESQSWQELLELLDDPGPATPEALSLRSGALAGLGRLGEADALLAEALRAHPDEPVLLAAQASVALERRQAGLALRFLDQAERHAPDRPETALLRARAYWMLNDPLGASRVRPVQSGAEGRFDGDWLLVEPRGEGRFLCAPRRSALYQVRRALDMGLDRPELHRIHAAIWRKLGRADEALAILEAHETLLMDVDADRTLSDMATAALECNRVRAFLHHALARYSGEGGTMSDGLRSALLEASDACALRGDAQTARSLLLRIHDARPDSTDALLRLGDMDWEAGDRQAARQRYTRVLQLDPRHAQRERLLSRLAP